MRWDRLTLGIGLSYALLAWSMGYGAVLPELRDEVHMSASIASLHGSLFGICLLLLATIGRRALAASSNRALLVCSVAGMFGGGILFGLGRSSAVTLAGAALAGAGSACLVIVVPAVIYAHQRDSSTQALAVLNTFPMLSSMTLPVAVGIAVAVGVTWRAVFVVPLVLIGAGIIGTAGRSTVPLSTHAEPIALMQLFRLPQFARRWTAMACGVLIEIGTGIWAASILVQRGGASKGAGAILTVGFFLGMAIGRMSLANLLRRFGGARVLTGSFVGVMVSLVPFVLGPGLVGRVVGLSLLGLTLSTVYPLALSRLFELHHDTEALGRAGALASGVGVTFGPLLLGAFSDLVGLGWATLVLPVFGLIGLWMIRPTRGSDLSNVRSGGQTPAEN
ncbi:MAG: major facilitator superfamily 1 [Ilumatobacteraceae bacterium]|nr:major facilitator superfamily 1 [Ilumatobacteraceae bacterium]